MIWNASRRYSWTLTGNVNEYETRIIDVKGVEDVLLVQTIPLYEDEKNTGTLSFGRNITERRKMEEALRESEEKYLRARQDGEPFKLVILDLTVPGGKGGRETIEELREIESSIHDILES